MLSALDQLSPDLIEQVLLKLGFSQPPSLDYDGLSQLYNAWCHKVPFDNIRKRIHLRENNPLPLPGYDNTEFFQGWLRLGVGGTCWAGNAALFALLDGLGFTCLLGTATMLTDSKQPPNHGTVLVKCPKKLLLVDASILHNAPLLLTPNKPTSLDHPAWGVACTPLNNQWLLKWRPLHMLDGCVCRIEDFPVTRDTFRKLNEVSRKHSPFNSCLYIRLNEGQSVRGISDGMEVLFFLSGEVRRKSISTRQRNEILIEKMGISEEIIPLIPLDQ